MTSLRPPVSSAVSALVTLKDGQPVTTSMIVAESFNKNHRDVLRSIDTIIESPAYQERRVRNFALTFASVAMPNGATRQDRMYEMDRQGFEILAMGFTGDEALRWKFKYSDAFAAMENRLSLPSLPTLPVLEASLVLAFNGLPIRFLIDETGHWQATYRDVATALGYLTKEAQYNARNVLKFTVKPGERQLRHPLYGDLISLAGLERVLLRAEHYRATAPDRADAALELGYWLAEVAAPLVAHPAAAAALLSSPGRLDERRLALADDPDYQQTACILRLWHEALGETAYTAAEVLRLATGTFQEALIEIGRDRWFSDQLNAKRLGKWLAVRQGQPVAAFQLDSGVKSSSKVRWWAVLALGGDSP
jgi:Rha family phage regulatory protein